MTSFSDSGAAATRTHSRMALELQGNRDRFQHCFDCSARTARTARFDSKAAIEVRCVLSRFYR
jgi:hypothetical protein